MKNLNFLLFGIKLKLKLVFYQFLCYIHLHPKKYYTATFKNYKNKVIDIYKCPICGKEVRNERSNKY